MHAIQPPAPISYPLATAIAIVILIGGLLPSSQATSSAPAVQESPGSAAIARQATPPVAPDPVEPPLLAARPLLEDDPEFAPKFQPVVARKRATRHQTFSQLDWVFPSTRLSPHPVWQ